MKRWYSDEKFWKREKPLSALEQWQRRDKYRAKTPVVAEKIVEKNTPNSLKKKSELDKNFATEGIYETDKSKKNRKVRELKKSNTPKKSRWIPTDQHRGDWNDK